MPHAVCRTVDELALDSRRLLWAAAEAVTAAGEGPADEPLTIAAWPAECPDIEASVERFVPTSILFRELEWSDGPQVLVDQSLDEFAGFISAIYMAESVTNYDWGRLKVIAGRTFLQPTSLPREDAARRSLMAALRKGVPVREDLGFRPRMLSRRLAGIDPGALAALSPAEQLALVTVIAARGGPAIFMSAAGIWPRSLAVHEAAERNRCRIRRLTLAGIPEEALQRIRFARYEAVPA